MTSLQESFFSCDGLLSLSGMPSVPDSAWPTLSLTEKVVRLSIPEFEFSLPAFKHLLHINMHMYTTIPIKHGTRMAVTTYTIIMYIIAGFDSPVVAGFVVAAEAMVSSAGGFRSMALQVIILKLPIAVY